MVHTERVAAKVVDGQPGRDGTVDQFIGEAMSVPVAPVPKEVAIRKLALGVRWHNPCLPYPAAVGTNLILLAETFFGVPFAPAPCRLRTRHGKNGHHSFLSASRSAASNLPSIGPLVGLWPPSCSHARTV